MYATKLMMITQPTNFDYIEDESLLFKRENEPWNTNASSSSAEVVHIANVRSGEAAFTYCGTIPLVTGWNCKVMTSGPYFYRYEDGRVFWRNYSSSGGLSETIKGSLDIQPYVAATMFFPTEDTVTFTLSVDGSETVQSTGAISGTWKFNATDVDFRVPTASRNTVMDLSLVYNRILTPKEIRQNYKAFLQRHR